MVSYSRYLGALTPVRKSFDGRFRRPPGWKAYKFFVLELPEFRSSPTYENVAGLTFITRCFLGSCAVYSSLSVVTLTLRLRAMNPPLRVTYPPFVVNRDPLGGYSWMMFWYSLPWTGSCSSLSRNQFSRLSAGPYFLRRIL